MKRILLPILAGWWLVIPALQPAAVSANETPADETLEVVIVKVTEETQKIPDGGTEPQLYQRLEAEVTGQTRHDQLLQLENGNYPAADVQKYQIGDKLMVTVGRNPEGAELFFISDYVRTDPLKILVIIFAGMAIMVGGLRGLTSLVGMAVSFGVIFLFILPKISAGADPAGTVIAGSAMMIPATFFLSHGLNKKTLAAMIGTSLALILTIGLAVIFIDAAKLTGFATEEAGFLQAIKPGFINIRGLLLAGIIIGVLGVLDDITVSQAAIVQQLKAANPKMKPGEVYRRAMAIGRDHIASMVNTLILVYAGASLPLLLLFVDSPRPFTEVVNNEIIADEVVRTLVGSIGLMAAVPITTVIANQIFAKEVKPDEST